ncbi:PAS domain-containing sensor histidine kinase [Pseudomonas sp. CFBP 8758]|uniref:PAS domain-containing sensor histidine kinase n=1 Tax=Pseudomonas sp. CFBP 8758 TaxID=2775286 RepID=UPI00313BADC2
MRDTDWSSTALADYRSWPASLRTSLSLVLNTKGIAALYWGPQQWLLYNDAYGLSLFELIHPDDLAHTQQGASLSADGHAYARFDNRYRHKDGSYRWISWSTQPDEQQINAVGRDFTAERESANVLAAAEEALRQSQKLEAIGQLTGGVAHDFNNLLTVIKSSTDLLKRPDLSHERRARYVSAIADTVERAAKVTSQLLAFARRQALQPTVFAPAENLRALASMIKILVGAEVELVMEIPEHSHFVIADPSQFDMAIVNMAVNARDAMVGQGCLIIRVGPASRGAESGEQPQVVISMTDTGSGIAPLHLGRIFEPFFTTKGVGQGTGLGLSQVFGFAKQSGGEITVDSEVDQAPLSHSTCPRHPSRASHGVSRRPMSWYTDTAPVY